MAEQEQKRAGRRPPRRATKAITRAVRAALALRAARENGVLPLARGHFALRDSATPKRRTRT